MGTIPESSEPMAPVPSPPGPASFEPPGPSARSSVPSFGTVASRSQRLGGLSGGRTLPWLRGLALAVLPFALGVLDVGFGSGGSLPGWGALVLSSVLSTGFTLTLGVELLLVAFWASRATPFSYRMLLSAPGASVLVAVAATLPPTISRGVLLVGAAFVVGWFVLLLQYAHLHPELDPRLMRYATEASVGLGIASAGWFLWALDGSPWVLASSVLIAPALLVRALPDRTASRVPVERVPWLLRPFWAFELLLVTFLAEFFAGALLDLEVAGPGFLQYIPFLPLAGATGSGIATAVYDGLWFAAAILASAWFLVAIGVTMGSLVVFRMRTTHHAAQRYRMGLMLAVFALAAIYLPSLASSTPLATNSYLASLPVIGWGFGLRSGGPFEAGIFLAILVMYATVGVLTVLFGRKALCAVMCGAALMYQGTTMHDMRQFNQTSRIGRYFLGSQLSTAYVVASTLALASLFGVSLLAFLHGLPRVAVANGDLDTAALPLPVELYFGSIWFVLFVSTPYIGTYNCATTGFCHWGSLSAIFATTSFFRLRVKDKKVCQACTTFDCAKSCPVGLVDMPLYFRTKGEYRSAKCCGVGDCVGACPYGNLYHQDVRAWLRRGFGHLRQPTGVPLPMIRPAAHVRPDTVPVRTDARTSGTE